jgi:hypothetical protein
MWESFKSEHQRSYASMEEEMSRFNTFINTLKVIDQRNIDEAKAGGSATHGITRFADLTQLEFETRYLTADVTKKSNDAAVMESKATPDTTAGVVDWTGKYTTPVKDQGN